MRTFVAVWPHPEVARLVVTRQEPDDDAVRWVREGQLHVTLRFLGEVAEERVPEVVDAVTSAVAGSGALTVSLGPTTERFGDRVLHVPVTGLDELAERVIGATAGLGSASEDDRPFVGHMTMGRARGRSGRVPPELAGRPLATAFMVRTVAVVVSEPHLDGHRYRTVAVVPLVASS
jgi:2'-5' RNA ligase